MLAPSLGGDHRAVDWWERFQRHAASPSAVDAQERVFMKMDIRALLPAIGVPTLVVHRTDDAIEPVGAGRYLGQAIPNARYVELVGADHLPWAGDQDALISELERFLGQMSMNEEETLDRVLATVLFIGIVDSTAKAAGMGDRRWREVREQHDRQTRAQLARYRGREVKTMGAGFSPSSTGRPAPPAARPGSVSRWSGSKWSFARACTPARSSPTATTSPESRSRLARESVRWPRPGRFSSRPLSRTLSWAQA